GDLSRNSAQAPAYSDHLRLDAYLTYIKPSLSLGLIVKISPCLTQQTRYTKPLKIFTFQPDSVTPT
ncbi:hypothetical protein P3491_35655, partial [Vibrio parahaemolyticus]|nr:hypothetical protein [Vibrio parahaemolyticus]